ncbi:hypothetical protein [Mucilaginibacter sp. CSA2-8R]|uniref:hypothetical protein n=1 Tax=Mucilaginibacter sp. CSA2-8R TaxID=3141542 RepID=UPI00315CD651
MNNKFFYAYLLGAVAALILAIYQLVLTSPKVSIGVGFLYLVPAIILFYMAYKVYHEKNDSELM